MKLSLLLHIQMAIVSMAMIYSSESTTNLHPVILVPGSGGNQLEARLTSKYKPSSLLCNRWYPWKKDSEGWFRLWFDPSVLFAPFTKCFNQRMKIYYDPIKDDYHNAPGVETRIRDFGSTRTLQYLDPNLEYFTSYMAPLVKSLEEIGYVDGKNLFGAPYDFRYGLAAAGHPSHVASRFLNQLKNLIETASKSNQDKPIILLSHSLGGLFALQLLNRNPISWRQKYIKHFIALSAPWGGTVEELSTFASGNTFGVPLVNPLFVREEQRSCSSNLWLLPSPKVFNKTQALAITTNGFYSAYDIPQFLEDIGFPEGVEPYKSRILPLVDNLVAPNVPITCIIGSGMKTAEILFYGVCGFDKTPEVVYGDGDGTVNMASLLAVENEWAKEENQPLKVIKLPGVSHTSILKDDDALQTIIGEIYSINSQFSSSLALKS